MPYSSADDTSLPSNVRKLSAVRRRQWISVYNSARARGLDEGRAITMANGVVKNEKSINTLEGFLRVLEGLKYDMDDKETKIAPFIDYEAKADGESGIVEGYASVFGARDYGRDMVHQGAFSKTLAERGDRIIYLPSHDYKVHVKDIPAVPVSVTEDSKGLHTVTKFLLNTTAGRESFAVIKAYQEAGRPVGLSYTFKPRSGGSKMTKDGRDLTDLDLYEYGHTALPMLDLARTTSAKADSNSAMHSEEVDHAHNHGDMIHSHSHTHKSDSEHSMYYASRHDYHDHSADQLKSLTFILDSDENKYDKSAREKMATDGVAMADGSFPVVDENDLKSFVEAISGSDSLVTDVDDIRRHLKRRATALDIKNVIPDDWTVTFSVSELKADDLLAEFEQKMGRKLSEEDSKKLRDALESVQTLLGQTEEVSVSAEGDDADTKAKKEELERYLASIDVRRHSYA